MSNSNLHIVIQALLAILDSPLNKAGAVKVRLHNGALSPLTLVNEHMFLALRTDICFRPHE